MSDFIFDREDAIKAIRQTKKNGEDWLYKNYPAPGGRIKKATTGFLVFEGTAYPVKALGRLANAIAGRKLADHATNKFRSYFEALGFQLINSPEDEADNAVKRQRRLANILARPGQVKFRQAVFDLFDRRCLITGCGTLVALEAAHILSVSDDGGDQAWNGIPLRADLHRLFDDNLISIDPSTWTLFVHKSVQEDYRQYHEKDLGPEIAKTGKGPELAKAFDKRKAQNRS